MLSELLYILNQMFQWFMLDFNIFGFHPFRAIYRGIFEGSLLVLLFRLVVIVFLCKLLYQTGVFYIMGCVIKTIYNCIKKAVKLFCKLVIVTYSLALIYFDAKKKAYNISEYWSRRAINTLGVSFEHVSGADNVTIAHPKYVLKVLDLIKKIKSNSFVLAIRNTIRNLPSFINRY